MQTAVQKLFDELVAAGRERGLQAAVYLQGRLVVDVWAGVADPVAGTLVTGGTLFPVFSTTKGIAATVVHRLAERGLLAYDAPVARYWREFAQAGKAEVTLRQVLNHSAGLAYLPGDIAPDQLSDWDGMCAWLAAQPPAWPPGSKVDYHALTYGWLVGEICRRVTGRSFAKLLQAEVCRPLGLTDLICGLPAQFAGSIAVLEESGMPAPGPVTSLPLAVPNTLQPLGSWMNQAAVQRNCLPGSAGLMTARAIARHYAALLPGGVDGVELLPPQRVRLATEPQVTTTGEPTGRFLGYIPYDTPATFGHNGYGGSIGLAEPQRQLAVGFVRNRLSGGLGDDTGARLLKILRAAVPIP